MVRPSNPRLMARVLDAVVNLSDTRGSSAREVLSFIRQSNVSPKNLTVQVHRALKHGVNAGLLRHRSGRYKALATLNPTSVPTPSVNKESTNDQNTDEKKSKPDAKAPLANAEPSSRRVQESKKTTSRQQNIRHRSRRSRSKAKRRSRRSPYPSRRSNKTVQNRKRRQRKRTYEDEEFEDQSSGRYIFYGRDDESSVPFNRKTKRSRVSKRELESDFSENDRKSDVNRKRVSRSTKPSSRQPRRRKEKTRTKEERDRSASRARSPQLLQRTMQARQHPIEEVGNDRQHGDEDRGSVERDVARSQETGQEEDVEGVREPNDSNSGSTPENSRD